MKITPEIIKNKKDTGTLIVLTVYDYCFAQLLDGAGVDILLVGDSVAMVCQGAKDTKSVTVEQMAYHTTSVSRGAKRALVLTDMPKGSYDKPDKAVENARIIIESGADAVKVEGGGDEVVAVVRALADNDIAVVGHLGLTPQTAESFKVRGKSEQEADAILRDAKLLEKAGAFALTLECIPWQLGEKVTCSINIPTIGIGAGAGCTGQVLVCYDMLGLFSDFKPKFVRRFADIGESVKNAVTAYRTAIKNGEFPGETERFSL